MNLINAKKGHEEGTLPVKLSTIYKWHSLNQYPCLVVKVTGKLFFDMDEWENMARKSIKNQEKEASRIRSIP